MKTVLFFTALLLCLFFSRGYAQVTDSSAQWTWMKGSNTTDQASIGTAGAAPAAGNTPGARQIPNGGISPGWVDASGNLWFFGGVGPAGVGYCNDIWKYDPATNMWTWVRGVNGVASNVSYGTLKTPAASNTPGIRQGSVVWQDNTGNIWIFGGYGRNASQGEARLNDLWRYNPADNVWTWMSGSNAGSQNNNAYGAVGVENDSYTPGSRSSATGWTDGAGNLWLFGGHGRTTGASSTESALNDLWRYNTTTNKWAYMGGSLTTNANGVYGAKGVGVSTNCPGARVNSAAWKDAAGNFWLFGGSGIGSAVAASYSTTTNLDDLWMLNPATGVWTWVAGSNVVSTPATYGTRGVGNASNTPGGRFGMASWVDVSGNFWIFGGGNSTSRYNDLWKYDVTAQAWAWMKGSSSANVKGIYGTKGGPPDAGNAPGGRVSSVFWTDAGGDFWLWSGYGFGSSTSQSSPLGLNDLWRLAPVVVIPVQPDMFTAAPSSVCQGASNVTYTIPAVSGATSYDWVYSGNGVSFSGGASTTQPTNNLTFSGSATGGTLSVRAVNSSGPGPYRDTVITVNAAPAQPSAYTASPTSVCPGQNGVTYTVPAVSGAATYEWTYTGTGGTFASGSSTTTPTNTVNFSGSATGGEVRVAAKNSCGTSTVRAVTVTVGSAPAQPSAYTASSASVCQDQNGVTYTVPAVSGASTYEWTYTGTGGTFTSGPSTTTPTNTVNFSGSGTGGEVRVAAKNSCGTSAVRGVTVTVNIPPVATISAAGPVDICAGDSVTLTAGTGTGYSYQWKHNGAPAGTGGDTYAASATGDYKVVVTGPGNCSDSTQEISVTVYDRPVVSLTQGDTAFCAGGVVKLEVNTQDTGLTYAWKEDGVLNPFATASFLEISESGSYKVIVGRATVASCEDSTNEVMITVHDLPVVDVTWDHELFHATPGYVSYQWHTGGQPVAGAVDSTFRPTSDGGYSVTVTDSNDCSGTSPVYNVWVGIADAAGVAAQVRIYPNPAGDVLYISAPVPVSVILSSVDGKVLQQQADASVLDIHDYAAGIYLLRIAGQDGQTIKYERFIKAGR